MGRINREKDWKGREGKEKKWEFMSPHSRFSFIVVHITYKHL